MTSISGPQYYRCRFLYLQHRFGNLEDLDLHSPAHCNLKDKELNTWVELHKMISQDALAELIKKAVLVMTPSFWGSCLPPPPGALLEDSMTGVCSTTNAYLSSPTLSSAEVHVLGSHGIVLPKTPIAGEVLADSFLSIDEGQDADFSTANDSDSECSGEDPETVYNRRTFYY